jgi:hypothetical protein
LEILWATMIHKNIITIGQVKITNKEKKCH